MQGNKPTVAYFCMEFGLHEDLRIYAGGLGILAGDILKAAKEENHPIIGVGILWRQGYTKQLIDEEGKPYDIYQDNRDIYNTVEDTGVEVSVRIRKRDVKIKVWKLEGYNNQPLYLLDTNIPDNPDKWITGQLYGWFEEERIAQEMILGIGGVRALQKLGIDVDIYHFNDGHPVFAGLELIKQKMDNHLPFEKAFKMTQKQIVFTTHTPVREGNESHDFEILNYMGVMRGLTKELLLEIGDFPFNMTVAGLRLAKVANGVSQLHAKTAGKMWEYVDNKASLKGITNGIHRNTWVDDRIISAFDRGLSILNVHNELKRELAEFIKDKTGREVNPDSLLLGFARRATAYKRPDLIFRKPDVIEPYLEKGKIQLVFSGKAHPFDLEGKGLIEKLVSMAEKYPQSVVFLEDYDMEIARKMTGGVDVWLNNPRRPLEASGTSGMKAAMNGVLNLSILDGWWPEAVQHGFNGWQFGDGYEGENRDEHDLNALYDVLFNEVLPIYYQNKEKWEDMMKASISSTYNHFSAKKMLNNYYEQMYKI